jgi:hypothetical protein
LSPLTKFHNGRIGFSGAWACAWSDRDASFASPEIALLKPTLGDIETTLHGCPVGTVLLSATIPRHLDAAEWPRHSVDRVVSQFPRWSADDHAGTT